MTLRTVAGRDLDPVAPGDGLRADRFARGEVLGHDRVQDLLCTSADVVHSHWI